MDKTECYGHHLVNRLMLTRGKGVIMEQGANSRVNTSFESLIVIPDFNFMLVGAISL